MRLRGAALAGTALLAMGSVSGAWASPKPATLNPHFANDVPSELKIAKGEAPCPVRVVALEDLRRSPEMIGVHQRRQIFAPADRAGWLKSIVQALGTRGVMVLFDTDAGPENVAKARIDLTTAWITDTKVNISANAVFHVRVSGDGSDRLDKYYRGGNSRMTYFSNGAPELQQAIDIALARALDSIAIDLRGLCSPSTQPAPFSATR